MMKPLSQHMTSLCEIAAALVRQPRFLTGAELEVFDAIRRADHAPCEGVRRTYAPMALITLLDRVISHPAGTDRTPWLIAIGALVPLVLAEAYAQFRDEKGVADG